ncbi:glycerate kinase [Bacillus niameyensis]|uniref:glycerate kinase n=1 Tax=Bacillus niameyensis TaxID=1522308 RepID=UPI000783E198|nr:glycerate kinase [Bacillus niameyensis]
MKIVIAPDSFKGSVTAKQAALAIERGIKTAFPEAETVLVPVADGGEGTSENLVAATNGHLVEVQVTGPLGQSVAAQYGVLGDGVTCVIEVASASGIDLIHPDERNPLKTTTYGTGQLIKQALDDGYRKFILGLGGSATNDGGVGMLQALGIEFKDQSGEEIGFGGGELGRIESINLENFDPRIRESIFLIASDVENPLVGDNGASYVYGPQKGATEQMVEELDRNLTHYADLVKQHTVIRLHDLAGAGAAGGIGGAFQAFFPSETERGVDVVLEYAKLEEHIERADLVITGEGQVDFQTAYGKTPMGVAQVAQKKGVPTIILAGSVGNNIENLYPYGVIGVYSILNRPISLDEAMENAEILLEHAAEQVCRTYFAKSRNAH